ncbi:uncharacterized protein NDAI_0C03160 [Naumovozyma dairenensis CBS 421]|uniref:Exportin-1 n=1 Tax=Naumovozyma dairenensis (strain ATCC 10597 / BCRC 20456 / CBS 421 / NBRC 0211 / NRRL Y-12639) TaxID=1071378 RepID=G0W865_NAUDC|nr:hypothetical protein NDAI_0C03160 [Naumovozyma dairenensis CBS 421]CCD23976.1 hypothetical protein NDAI_0C03160 [Naumovozyma dairenensis CBS 421]
MERITNNDGSINVNALDQIVDTFYKGTGPEQEEAQIILDTFQKEPYSWSFIDKIIQDSKNDQTKFISLSILDNTIQKQWNTLPIEQKLGIRNFLVGMIRSLCQDKNRFRATKGLLQKADLTLIDILKHEWPDHWDDFIPELTVLSSQTLEVCQNNVYILRLLSEEIFDLAPKRITQAKLLHLKEAISNQVDQIFQYFISILESTISPSVRRATSESILCYLQWIPLNYIYETELIELLISQVVTVAETRPITLKCLMSIIEIDIPEDDFYNERKSRALQIFDTVINMIKSSHVPNKSGLLNTNDSDEVFQESMIDFIKTFLIKYRSTLENDGRRQELEITHQYLLESKNISEPELFRNILEYWKDLAFKLNILSDQHRMLVKDPVMSAEESAFYQKVSFYQNYLSELSSIIIDNMEKPEEVVSIIDEDEDELITKIIVDGEENEIYLLEKEVLRYTANLDRFLNIQKIFYQEFTSLDTSEGWSITKLNSLCWALGAIPKCLEYEDERKLLLTFLEGLSNFSMRKADKKDKIACISNILYLSSRYPKSLNSDKVRLENIIIDIFKIIKAFTELQSMACDTFMKIVQQCKYDLINSIWGEPLLFMKTIIGELEQCIPVLEHDNVNILYESCGLLITEVKNAIEKEQLMEFLMAKPKAIWGEVTLKVQNDFSILLDSRFRKVVMHSLQMYSAVCKTTGPDFFYQFQLIYPQLLQLYALTTSILRNKCGSIASGISTLHDLLVIQKGILKLIELYISKSKSPHVIVNKFINPLFETILNDYKKEDAEMKNPEVLNCLTVIVTKVGSLIQEKVTLILEFFLECTVEMIDKNFDDYSEIQHCLYEFINATVKETFQSVLELPESYVGIFFKNILWAIQDPRSEIQDIGFQLANKITSNIHSLENTTFTLQFYKYYYLEFVCQTFSVMTDTCHQSEFVEQSILLMNLISMVFDNKVVIQLDSNKLLGNEGYLRKFISSLISSAFPHVEDIEITNFLNSLLVHLKDPSIFRRVLRDFLIQLKESHADLNNYLDVEQREKTLWQSHKLERQPISRLEDN